MDKMKIIYYFSSMFQPFGKAFESTLNQGLKSFDGAFKGVRQMIGGKSGVRSQGIKSLDGAFEDVRQMLGGKSGVRDQGIKSFDGSFEGVRQMIGGKSGVRGSVRHEGAGGKSLSRPTASKSRPKNSGFPDFQDFRPPKDFGVRILTFTSSDNLQTLK